MSIPVELENLEEVMARYRFAYLITVTEQGTPHVVQVVVLKQGDDLIISNVGNRTRANIEARPLALGVVWPPVSETEYSLIVDGTGKLSETMLIITPTHAVLHRPVISC